MTGSHSYTRRTFLSTGVLAVAGLGLGLRPSAFAQALLPDPIDPHLLRQLANVAIDAARVAGATYADVRVAEVQRFSLGKFEPLRFVSELEARYSHGIRVVVDGAWGFVHGEVSSVDAITAAARSAVVQARDAARVVATHVEGVPTAVATGEWRTPIVIDPFTVPLHEQMALLRSWADTATRVWGVTGPTPGVDWRRETRVFASTDGSLVTQTFYRVERNHLVGDQQMRGGAPVGLLVPISFATSGGYETVQGPDIDDRIKAVADEVHRYAALPARTLAVGRYPVVFDGMTLAAVVGQTVGPALEMDRVLGDEDEAGGTSYLAPASVHLGAPLMSPLLTITADRASPSVTSARWDDEGVEPAADAVIERGRLVDYQTSRDSAATLATWYQQRSRPVASTGSAFAAEASHPVKTRVGHLTVTPAAGSASLEDLIRDMAHGIVVRQGTSVATDQQMTTGSIDAYGATLLEVERGRIVRRIQNAGLQWNTLGLLRGVTALGDASTVADETHLMFKGQPWRPATSHTTAPAAAFREINVIDIGRPV